MARQNVGLRPFFSYYGGKYRMAPHYPEPAFDTIVEPFAGSAGYATRYPRKNVILYDIDENIVQTWRYLISVTAAEILSLPDLPEGQSVDDLNVAPEARKIIGWWLNSGTSAPRKSASAWMRANPGSYWGANVRFRIASQLESIRHWRIEQGSYADIENRPATWFVDPPYEAAGKHYRKGSSGIDFAHLGAWCKERTGQTIVCEADDAAWLPFRDFMASRGSSGKQKVNPAKREVIWTNDFDPVIAEFPWLEAA